MKYSLALDQGTTSSRAIVWQYRRTGNICAGKKRALAVVAARALEYIALA